MPSPLPSSSPFSSSLVQYSLSASPIVGDALWNPFIKEKITPYKNKGKPQPSQVLTVTDHSVVGDEVGGGHHLEGAGPEPSVDVDGLEVSGLATFDFLVAETAGGVDVLIRK